ncbi:uncharacterized [Tachysurus ichikawai]
MESCGKRADCREQQRSRFWVTDGAVEASTDQSSMTVTGWPVGLEQHGHNRAEATRQDTELILTATGSMPARGLATAHALNTAFSPHLLPSVSTDLK